MWTMVQYEIKNNNRKLLEILKEIRPDVDFENETELIDDGILDAFVERNHTSDKSRYMLWVQQQNTAAVAMYKKKGFTSLGKSTLSLIRTTN